MHSGLALDGDNTKVSKDEPPRTPVIIADIASGFTYASYQNAIPVLRAIRIENHGDRHLETCRLELTSDPSFLRPKV